MELQIESLNDYNMSDWEATHTFDVLKTSTNKNNILEMISLQLNNGVEKNSLIIFDSSFKIANSYKAYFSNSNILSLNTVDDIQNIMYLGKIIPFEYNENLSKIQYLFNSYKSLNSIIQNYKTSRVNSKKYVSTNLIHYINLLSTHSMELVLDKMFNYYNDYLKSLFSNNMDFDKESYEKTKNALSQKYHVLKNKYSGYLNKSMSKSKAMFIDTFSKFSRPVVGIYNNITNTIEIINANQMYEKGKNCTDSLGLISITRNSPIKLKIHAVGTMEQTFNYLITKNHTFSNDDTFLSTLFNSTDSDINLLAKKVLNKIQDVTNTNKMSITLIIHS